MILILIMKKIKTKIRLRGVRLNPSNWNKKIKEKIKNTVFRKIRWKTIKFKLKISKINKMKNFAYGI